MDTLDAIEKLAQQARREKAPEFNVAERILYRLSPEEEDKFSFLVLELIASVSAVAASVVGYFSVGALRTLTSPLMQFLTPLQEIKLW
ncbi:MAG: hypothetical protein JXM79_24915 [Sedimentisphaerales bacterium]|nr:hypothetical protein [Sedimentisphaerales bacterium]